MVKATQGASYDSTEYDALGRTKRSLQKVGAGVYVLLYAYDDVKRQRTLTLRYVPA